ncbi:hypothetical protein IJG91_02620 [Candidatus Saccharibacteria bacterium]|nr:hypothetical protein [Candidatus Saccharibacteria bacterium]
MNNKDYLEKIAADTRTGKPKAKGLLGTIANLPPTTKKLLLGGVIAVFVIMIFGIIVSGGGDKNKEIDLVEKINLRTENMMEDINSYNKLVKSSELRSLGNSLNAVLTETNYAINTSLKEDFGVKSTTKTTKEKTQIDEDAIMEEMTATLENGRLNAILDRVYAREFAYQIAMLIALEQETYSKTKKENLRSVLTSSMNNLDSLHTQFDDFEAK